MDGPSAYGETVEMKKLTSRAAWWTLTPIRGLTVGQLATLATKMHPNRRPWVIGLGFKVCNIIGRLKKQRPKCRSNLLLGGGVWPIGTEREARAPIVVSTYERKANR